MISPTATGDVPYVEAARLAGYGGNHNTLRVQGARLAHDPAIRDAMLEEGIGRLGSAVPVATAVLVQLAQVATKDSTRLKAISMILNRAGIPEATVHNVNVRREESEGEKIERAVRLAKAMGLDPKALLGRAGVSLSQSSAVDPEGEVVDAEVVATTEGIEDLLPSDKETFGVGPVLG